MSLRTPSLRSTLVLAVAIAVGPVILLNLRSAAETRERLEAQYEAESALVAEQVSTEVGRYLEDTRQLVDAVAHFPAVREQNTAEASALLAELRTLSPLFANLLLVDKSGTPIASSLPLPPRVSGVGADWFESLQQGGNLGIGGYRPSYATGAPSLYLASPIPGQDPAGPRACLAAAIDLEVMQTMLRDVSRPGGSTIALLDHNGIVLAQRGHRPFAAVGHPFPGWSETAAGTSFRHVGPDDRIQTVRATRTAFSNNAPWVVMGLSRSEEAEAIRRSAYSAFTTSTVFTAIAFAIVSWIAHHFILGPTRKISRAASALTAGQWATRANTRSGTRELVELGETFDTMADHLQHQFDQSTARSTATHPGTGAATDDSATARQRLREAIAAQQASDEALRHTVAELEKTLSQVKTLSGLLPICAGCKRIRDDRGYWNSVEQYIRDHTQAECSHGLCPDCIRRLYPEFADEIEAGTAPPPPPPAS